MSKPIMCHLVAGYPDAKACLNLMQGLAKLNPTALEVQIPFSDPIADGSTIMQANDAALANGVTTAGSFELIERARASGVDSDLYIMSYAQKVRHFELAAFCERAAKAQTKGLIVPDLPYDTPEFAQLHDLAGQRGLELVPVLSPGMPGARLEAVLALGPSTLYITSTRGITGNAYAPAKQLRRLVDDIKRLSDARIMLGFGIATPQDVKEALEFADIAVVGSAIIKQLQTGGVPEALNYVRSLL